jgi:uncharacterized Ntn-hydrolase superfamily protein
MKKVTILLFMFITISVSADEITPLHPVNTYSIVCYDSTTGQFGAAVQSHWFKVANVIWAEAGVGAVATQSLADYSYGPLGLEMMKKGKSAKQALEGIIASDPNSNVRQVAMIDKNMVVMAHTGDKCIPEAGHRVGSNYSVQANLMEKNTVWDAMAIAFENTQGDLADKMMAALEAAQAEGGDIRGKQSAAMIVVSGEPTDISWIDNQIEIRVDDHAEPLKELKRLLTISRAYDHMYKGDDFIVVNDFDNALKEYSKAADLLPGNLEVLYWHAATLVVAGEIERAMPIFKKVFDEDENWRTLTPRLVEVDLLPKDEELLKRIMEL